MAQNYTRQSIFADGDTITAALFNDEYNQLFNTFKYSSTDSAATGHRHDGTAGEGGNIYRIGDLDFLNKIEADSSNNRWGVFVEVGGSAVEQVRIQDGAVVPVTNNDVDLGSASLQFKDLYIDGTANIDSLVADTADINGGTVDGVTIGGSSAGAGSFTTLTASGDVNFDSGTLFVDASADAVGIGTTSPSGRFDVDTDDNTYLNVYTSNTNSAAVQTFISGATSDGAAIGYNVAIRFGTATGKNAASFSEKMRIDSSGNLLVGTQSVDSAGSKIQLSSFANRVFTSENSSNTSGDQNIWSKLGSNCNNISSLHFLARTGATDRCYIYGNGDIDNTNNSYGGISDLRLKENITEATPKLDKLNQVRVVNYNLIGDDRKLLGVVAQELEQIFPGMVDESPDRDEEGNTLGTTTKSVKYSVFVPMLIKAMQEQQEIIDGLRARVAALEA